MPAESLGGGGSSLYTREGWCPSQLPAQDWAGARYLSAWQSLSRPQLEEEDTKPHL